MPAQTQAVTKVGVLGGGEVGCALVTRLAAAKFTVAAFDSYQPRQRELAAAGAFAAVSVGALLKDVQVLVLNPQDGGDAVQRFEQEIAPACHAGQVFVDLAWTRVDQTQALARQAAARGCVWLDAPALGGVKAAARGALTLLAGGTSEILGRCDRVLKAIAGLGVIHHCGGAGSGQAARESWLLCRALTSAAVLEALAHGRRLGLEPSVLIPALELTDAAGVGVQSVAKAVLTKGGENVSVHLDRLPELAQDAGGRGDPLPLTEALLAFLKNAPRTVIEHDQLVPSFWNELKRRSAGGGSGGKTP